MFSVVLNQGSIPVINMRFRRRKKDKNKDEKNSKKKKKNSGLGGNSIEGLYTHHTFYMSCDYCSL